MNDKILELIKRRLDIGAKKYQKEKDIWGGKMREGWHNEVVLAVFLFFTSIFLMMILIGCDFRESALIREQTETFTGEIKEKNKDMQSLANKLEIVEQENRQLKQQLLCRDELINEQVEQAKRDMLKDIPVLDIAKPNKSNKAETERLNKE